MEKTRAIRNVSPVRIVSALIPFVLFASVIPVLSGYLATPPIGDDYARVYGAITPAGLSFSDFMQGQLGDRPVLMLFTYLGLWLHRGDTFAFKLTSITLHSLNAVLLYALVVRSRRRMGGSEPAVGRESSWAAFRFEGMVALAAFAWAVHPTHWSALVSIIQIGVPLSFFFGLASIHYVFRYLETRASKYLTIVCGLFLVALLAKGTLVLLPLLILLLPVGPDESRDSRRRAAIATGGVSLLYLFYAWLSSAHYFAVGLSYPDYLFAQGRVFFWSIEHLVGTRDYRFFYDFMPFVLGPIPERSIYGGSILIGFVVFSAVRGRALAAVGAIAAFVAFVLPEAVIRLPDLFFDHRMYCPLGFAIVAYLARSSVPAEASVSGGSFKRVLSGLAIAGLLVFSIVSAERSIVLASKIDSPEKYLFWEIAGPKHQKDNGLFSLVANLDGYPYRRYHEDVAERAIHALRERYPESPVYPAELDFDLYMHRRRKRAPVSLANDAFRRIIVSFVTRSTEMSIEIPVGIFCGFHRSPDYLADRPRRFLSILAMGKVMEANREFFSSFAIGELPSLKKFWSLLGGDVEYFALHPLTPAEREKIGVGSDAFETLEREISRYAAPTPESIAFFNANREVFRKK